MAVETALTTLAVRAVTALASRASKTEWISSVKKAVLKADLPDLESELRYLREEQRQVAKIEQFLQSDTAHSVLLTYVLRYGASTIPDHSDAQLEAIFIQAAANYSGQSIETVSSTARGAWSRLTALIQLALSDIMESNELDANDSIMLAGFNEVRKSSNAEGPGDSYIQQSIQALADLTAASQRLHAVDKLVAAVRRGVLVAFGMIDMPHAPEVQEVAVSSLYVSRNLRRLAINWDARLDSRDESEGTLTEDALCDRRAVIVGNPGAGKSTFVKQQMLKIAESVSDRRAPVLLEVRAWPEQGTSVLERVLERIANTYQYITDLQTVEDAMRLGRIALIFDAIDEAPTPAARRWAARSIDLIALHYPLSSILVTSRQVGYHLHRLSPIHFSGYLLDEFNNTQVREYVTKWFNTTQRLGAVIDAVAFTNGFMHESDYIHDLRGNPLLLSLICISYRREGYIPKNRAEIYRECARLLFRGWDRLRSISSPIDFDRNTLGLLQEIARALYSSFRADRWIGETELSNIVGAYVIRHITDDPVARHHWTRTFLEYCAGRAWVLSRVGVRDGETLYAFTHKTFLEYYYACSLVWSADTAKDLAAKIEGLLERPGNEVVAQLAVDEYGQSDPGRSDSVIRFIVFDSDVLEHRFKATRLRFVIRSLIFWSPSPPVVRAIIRACLEYVIQQPDEISLAEVLESRYPREFEEEGLGRTVSGITAIRRTEISRGYQMVQALKEAADDAAKIGMLLRSNPTLMVRQVCLNRIDARKFVESVGNGSLLQFQALGVWREGPLALSLRESMRAGYVDDDTIRILKTVSASPKGVDVIATGLKVRSVIDDLLEESAWSRERYFGIQLNAEFQPLPGLSLMLCGVMLAMLRANDTYDAKRVYRLLSGHDPRLSPSQAIDELLSSGAIAPGAVWKSFLLRCSVSRELEWPD